RGGFRHVTAGPWRPGIGSGTDDLDDEAGRIAHREAGLAEPHRRGFHLDAASGQPRPPEIDRRGRHRKGHRGDLSGPDASGTHAVSLVGEGGPDGARRTDAVAVVEVIDERVVEVDSL